LIDVRHLRYFLAVAQELNFSRAAEKLNMAQPPLSRQIQLVEAELGVKLFNRDSRPLSLTPGGMLFREQALGVIQRLDEMRGTMKRFAASERPRFVIGFVPSVIYARLPRVIRGFRELAPEVELSLIEMMSIEQIAALKEGRIDVGFGRVRFDDPALRREVLREERLVVAVPLGHRFAGERPVSLADLAEEALVIYPREPRPSYADQVLSIFRDRGLEPAQIHEVRELQTAIGLVASAAGVCIVPASVRLMERGDVVYRDLAEIVTSPIILSYRSNDTSEYLGRLRNVIDRISAQWPWPSTVADGRPSPDR
jgi:DNA-binding transcriptional LysR family regulator